MSDHTNRDLYFETKANYIQRHVGGKNRPPNNSQYVDNQLNLIQAGDKFLPPNVRQNNNQGKINGFNTGVPYSRSLQGGNLGSGDSLGDTNLNAGGQGSINNFSSPENPYYGQKRDIYMRNEKGRFDPYKGFLYDHGLMEDGTNRRRFK